MRLPTWDVLIAEQLDVLDHPLDQPLFVAGPPGSGKTVLAVQRARMLADAGRSVTGVTYNRMLRRLATLLDGAAQTRVNAQTMHGFVWHDYMARTGAEPPMAPGDPYSHDWRAMVDTLNGVSSSVSRLDHLVVDEGQDLPADFFRYAHRHAARVLTVFADDDQALNERRSTLEQIKAAAGLSDPVILQENHRNTPEIAAVAEHFHGGRLPAAMVRRGSIRHIPSLVRAPGITDIAASIGQWFTNRGGTIGVVVDQNATGQNVYNALRTHYLPGRRVDLYTSDAKNEDSIELFTPGVTILNQKSIKGLEFDTVFVLELERFVPCVTEAMRRVMYMLCARARDYLFLVHGPGELSPRANAALPDESRLRRYG